MFPANFAVNFCHALSGVLVTAHNGAEGLEAWRQHTPDIIITDIRMPAMDGLAMLQEIRSVDRAVPVIIMSAFEETEYLIRSIDIGVSGYTIKPVNVNKFTEVLLNCAHGLLVEAKLEQARTALRKQHEFTKATLDGQGAYICVINTQGDIVTTNSAWDNFAAENSATPGTCSVGSNYLDVLNVCLAAAEEDREDITEFQTSLTAVLEGTLPRFTMEYDCSSLDEVRWFLVTVNPFTVDDELYAVISHGDITPRKQAEELLRESESRFKGAFDYSAIGMALVSKEGKWLKANVSLCKMLGYAEEELLTKTFQDITHPDDLEMDLNYVSQLLAGEIETYSMEKRYFHRQGEIIWILLAGSLVRDSDGSPLYFIAQIENITERKRVEHSLQERNKELGCLYSIISLSNDPGISFDELFKRAVMRIPPAWQFPDTTEACIEIGGKGFQTARFEETPWMLVQEIIAQDNKVGKVTVCSLEERTFLQEELTLLNAIAENLGLIVMRELAKETISRLAVTDELTSLNNRRFFNESFSKAVSAARRHRQPLSLISIDLDHFKKVNDTFGHTMGDLVLKEFSLSLKMMVRVEDIACRLGGEEFIVLLPNTTSEASVVLADRMRCSFEQYPRTTTPVVTASFGVAQLQEGEDEDALLRRVDAALYRAKNEGRNRVVAV